jgi:hypothetical protein
VWEKRIYSKMKQKAGNLIQNRRDISVEFNGKKELSLEQRNILLQTLKARFEVNMHRHRGLDWAKIQ